MNLTRKTWLALPEFIRRPIRQLAYNAAHKDSETFDITRIDAGARIAIYIGDGTKGAHHIYRQWRDVFQNLNLAYVAIFRHNNCFSACVKEYPSDPLVFVKRQVDISTLLTAVPSLSMIFFTGNTGNNVHLFPLYHIKQIFIGHGDSEKADSASRMFRAYDEIWVAGRGHIERLSAHVISSTYRVIGRPQILNLLLMAHVTRTPKVAAYLPTWEGASPNADYSSLELSNEIIKVITEAGFSIHVKLHPSTGSRITTYKSIESKLQKTINEETDRMYARNATSVAIMSHADLCITDVSSIISDWLITKKPIFVYIGTTPPAAGNSITIEEYAYCFKTPGELKALIRRVIIDGDDYKSAQRSSISDHLVSSEATLQNNFSKYIHQHLNGTNL